MFVSMWWISVSPGLDMVALGRFAGCSMGPPAAPANARLRLGGDAVALGKARAAGLLCCILPSPICRHFVPPLTNQANIAKIKLRDPSPLPSQPTRAHSQQENSWNPGKEACTARNRALHLERRGAAAGDCKGRWCSATCYSTCDLSNLLLRKRSSPAPAEEQDCTRRPLHPQCCPKAFPEGRESPSTNPQGVEILDCFKK